MKTLQECKEEVARDHYWDEWNSMCPNGYLAGVPDKWVDEAAELIEDNELREFYRGVLTEYCNELVLPLQARIKELEQEIDRLKG